jgi:hypothetical protein
MPQRGRLRVIPEWQARTDSETRSGARARACESIASSTRGPFWVTVNPQTQGPQRVISAGPEGHRGPRRIRLHSMWTTRDAQQLQPKCEEL